MWARSKKNMGLFLSGPHQYCWSISKSTLQTDVDFNKVHLFYLQHVDKVPGKLTSEKKEKKKCFNDYCHNRRQIPILNAINVIRLLLLPNTNDIETSLKTTVCLKSVTPYEHIGIYTTTLNLQGRCNFIQALVVNKTKISSAN